MYDLHDEFLIAGEMTCISAAKNRYGNIESKNTFKYQVGEHSIDSTLHCVH